MPNGRQSGEKPARGGGRPRLRAADIALGLWRAKWLMLVIFIPLALLSLLLASRMPVHSTSETRLLVTLGQEHVFQTGADTATPELREMTLAELEFLKSRDVAERALSRFPLGRVYPELSSAEATDGTMEVRQRLMFRAGVERLRADLSVESPTGSPILIARYDNADPDVAAEVLNALVGAYLSYRLDILKPVQPADDLHVDTARAPDLPTVEAALVEFHAQHEFTDFESEHARAQMLSTSITEQLQRARVALEGSRSAARATRARLDAAEPEIDLFREDSSGEVLQDLIIERENLLQRYTPESRTIAAIDQRIQGVRRAIGSRDSTYARIRRGPNPVRQALEARLDALEADAAGRQQEVTVLQRQLAENETALARFAELAPDWQMLQRDFADAEKNPPSPPSAPALSSDTSPRSVGSIRILEPARAPLASTSLALPIAVSGMAIAALMAFFAGLVAAYSRRSFATAGSLSTTTGLPVVATIPRRR